MFSVAQKFEKLVQLGFQQIFDKRPLVGLWFSTKYLPLNI